MKSLSKLAPVALFLSLSACDPTIKPPPPVDLPAPVLEKAAPNLIAVGGGTLSRIYGDNFQDGLEVFVGDVKATDVTWVSSRAVIARIPAGTADASVALRVVNPDKKAATLPDAIRYDLAPSITDARMTMADPSEFDGVDSVEAQVEGSLFVPTATGTTGVGQGQGVRAQVAVLPKGGTPPTQDQFTEWVEASYNRDSSTLPEWDVYRGVISLPPATGRTLNEYWAVVRFSVDGGATWVHADKDGISNGWSNAALPVVRVGARRPEWCKTNDIGADSPITITYAVGQAANAVVRAQVHVSGVTNSGGLGRNVEMDIGYGSASADPASWTWVPATYKGDLFGANDEFQATLPNPAVPGTYRWVFRAAYNAGPYRYCSIGDNKPFGIDQTNILEVTGTTPTVIDWCKLGPSPSDTTVPTEAYAVGVTGDLIVKGLVYEAGVTDQATPPPGSLQVGLGYGPAADAPSSGSWNWVAATFSSHQGENDEFEATLPNPSGGIGQYKYAFRARTNAGAYAYCDADGTAVAGFTADKAGNLNVVPQCRLEAISAASVQSGASLTIEGSINCGSCATIQAEAGVGPRDTDASKAPAWSWKTAPFDGASSRHKATVGPAISGNRHVSFRYKTDLTGDAWFYCDADGNNVGRYTTAQQLALTVTTGSRATAVDFCTLRAPLIIAPAQLGTVKAVGEIWEENLTKTAGAPAGVVAEIGTGPADQDPGVSWTFTAATYKGDVAGCGGCEFNDQFEALLPGTPAIGTGYTLRFSRDAGAWCYADADGNGGNTDLNGFSVVTSNQPAAPNIGLVQ